MNWQILTKNLNIHLYLRKNIFIHHNTFEDFHNDYLRKDVLLLTDSFEKFISIYLKYYNLDPCHYFSAPGLSWDAILKMTEVELEKNKRS